MDVNRTTWDSSDGARHTWHAWTTLRPTALAVAIAATCGSAWGQGVDASTDAVEATRKPLTQMAQATQLAQASTGDAPAAAAPTAKARENDALESVTVTAQRRSQSLQEVPLSVSAVTADSLDRNGVVDLSRLDALVPGLKFGQSGNDARPAIRGTRTQNVIGNADPVVTYYVDGIYRSRPSQALSTFVDVERVEVLRGPQGTLFGRNSFGGSVNVISNRPDASEAQFGLGTTFTSYSGVRSDVYGNIPLSEGTAIRLAGYRSKSDGWVNNSYASGNGLHDDDNSFARVSLGSKVTNDLSLLARAEFWHGGGAGPGDFGYYTAGIPINPATGATNGVNGIIDRRISPAAGRGGGVVGYVPLNANTPSDPNWRSISWNLEPERRVTQQAYSGEAEYDFGFATAKAIISRTQYSEFRQGDPDYSSQPLWWAYNYVTTKTNSQELQLVSKPGGVASWVTGLYFLQDTPTDLYLFGDELTPGAAGLPVRSQVGSFNPTNQPDYYLQGPYKLKTNAQAIYADGSLNIVPQFTVLGGLRYTRDEKTGTWENPNYVPDGAAPTTRERSFNKLTYRVGVQTQYTTNNNVYATYSTGFLSGGFSGSPDLNPIEQQTAKALEIGSKNLFLNGHLRLNGAAYINRYSNLLTQRLIFIGGAVQSQLANAGKAEGKGVEIEADYRHSGLNLGLRAAYNKSKFGDFIVSNSFTEGGNLPGGRFQLSGLQVPLNPEFTTTLLGSYDVGLGKYGVLSPGATFYYSSSYRTSDQPYFFANQDSYSKVDIRLRWRSAEGPISIEAYVENLTNEQILLRSTPNAGSVIYQDYAPPRMVGLRLSYRY